MIRSKYTLDADKAMFEAIVKGASIEEAIKISEQHRSQSKNDDDDIEMF